MDQFHESGMIFQNSEEKTFFKIDDCHTYLSMNKHLKIADFLMLEHKARETEKLFIIEAKQSIPRDENTDRHAEFTNEIISKLVHGLSLGLSLCLKRHHNPQDNFPDRLHKIKLDRVEFKLVVILRSLPVDACNNFRSKLQIQMRHIAKLAKIDIQSILVMNENMAKTYGIVIKGVSA